MRMQANLFRDIARTQNQEFSALISSALRESPNGNRLQAIIAALSQLQTNRRAADRYYGSRGGCTGSERYRPNNRTVKPGRSSGAGPAFRLRPSSRKTTTAKQPLKPTKKTKKRRRKRKRRKIAIRETSPAAENNQQEKQFRLRRQKKRLQFRLKMRSNKNPLQSPHRQKSSLNRHRHRQPPSNRKCFPAGDCTSTGRRKSKTANFGNVA